MTTKTYDRTETLDTLTVKYLNVLETANIPTEDVTEVLLSNGTVGAPSLSFIYDPTTGLLYSGGLLEFTVGGVIKFTLSSTGAGLGVPLNMNTNVISGVGNPIAQQDVVTRNFFESRGGSWWNASNTPLNTTVTTAGTFYALNASNATNNCYGNSNWSSPSAGVIQWNGYGAKVVTIFISCTLSTTNISATNIGIILAKNGTPIGPAAWGTYISLSSGTVPLSTQLNIALSTGDQLQIYGSAGTNGTVINPNYYSITAI